MATSDADIGVVTVPTAQAVPMGVTALPVANAAAVPVATAVAMPMTATAVPMQQAVAPIAGTVDEDTGPSELWRTYQRFHPDKGLIVYWTLLAGTAVAVGGIVEAVEFFANGGLDQFFSDPPENTTAVVDQGLCMTCAPFLVNRVVDVFILGDFVRSFFTAYRLADGSERPRRQPPCGRYEARGRIETRSNMIVRRYLTSWFMVDLLILISSAIDLMDLAFGGEGPIRVLRVVRIIRAAKDFQIAQTVFCQSKPPPAAA